jgi:hypothetical protein
MAVAWVAAGSGVATTTTTLALIAPTVIGNDVLFAQIISNNNTAVVAPSGWTLIADTANTAAMQSYLGWKRVGDDASGATFNFTVAGTTLSFGQLVAYRGVTKQGNPHGGFSSSANISSDNVTYATLIPAGASRPSHFVAFGYYNLSATTAGAFSGTDPTFTARVDIETATGNTASLFTHDGPSLTGIATGSRTLATASTVDAINHGYMIDLIPGQTFGGAGGSTAAYPALARVHSR